MKTGEDVITTEKRLGDRQDPNIKPSRARATIIILTIIAVGAFAFWSGFVTATWSWIDLIK